jgi:hypothetical protein
MPVRHVIYSRLHSRKLIVNITFTYETHFFFEHDLSFKTMHSYNFLLRMIYLFIYGSKARFLALAAFLVS